MVSIYLYKVCAKRGGKLGFQGSAIIFKKEFNIFISLYDSALLYLVLLFKNKCQSFEFNNIVCILIMLVIYATCILNYLPLIMSVTEKSSITE